MTSQRLSGILLALAVSLSVVLAPPAAAAQRASELILVVVGPGPAAPVAHLVCDPPGGSHPQPAAACAELAAVGGDFDQLGDENLVCTMEYRPLLAVAWGHWRGQPVRWYEEFANPCLLSAATRTVFEF